ncbi:hypothetical protein MWG61_13370 [Bacillus safensis]|uniref:hypothetical protein n=1 Tax=Bacillus safensis TaxID=561879 RepID=UPI0022813457|nr:hypothetical protein [Bacillus safensis]MCY7525130.1 hypothetical protein [Bacillus safensis]
MTNSIKETQGITAAELNQAAEAAEAQVPANVTVVTGVEAQDASRGLTIDMFKHTDNEIFSTLQLTDNKSRKHFYNAINSAKHAVGENINKRFKITNIIAHPVQLMNEETGELENAMRVIFIDEKGEGWHSVSTGIAQSAQRIIFAYGQGPWDNDPIEVEVKQQKTRNNNNILVLEIV